MKRINLQDLPRWSRWPARLLGLSDWKVAARTIEKIDSEYDKDKYASCLTYLESRGGIATPEDVKSFEFGTAGDEPICVSMGNDLYEVSLEDARSRYYALLRDQLGAAIENSSSVVELGAGYGYNLWMLRERFPGKSFVGGEYSTNATKVANLLYSKLDGIAVRPFNFYVPETYEFLAGLEPPLVIFTSHAMEQLPRSAPLLDNLLPYRDKIASVLHFEPLHESSDSTLLQLLRRRYTELNDYNRDLLSELRARPEIEVVSVIENVYGLNPLNPSSVLRWRFS